MTARAWVACLVIVLATAPAVAMALESSSITALGFASNATDALLFRSASELLASRRSPYDATLQAANLRDAHLGALPSFTVPFLYPPNALPLFALYRVGSPRFGYVAFTTVGTLLLLSAVYLLMGALGHAEKERLVAVLGVGLGGATLFNAQLGQTGAFAAAFALLYVLAHPRSHAWAGFFLGLLAFKPQYALFLAAWPLAARHVRVLLVAVVTVIASTVVSGAAFGWERIREFGAAVVTPNATAPNMANWFSLIHPPSPVAAMCVALGAFLALLGLCVYAHRRGAAMLGVAGISTAVALVASPNTHPYDLILWMLPLLALTRRSRYPGALILVPMVAAYPFIRPDLRFVLALASLALVILTARQLRDEFTQLAPAPRRSGA